MESKMKTACLIVLIALNSTLFSTASAKQNGYDIFIYGGSSAGIAAAIQRARM